MFSRIAIINRGEAAMRLIHAVRELNAEGGEQIETVALYTDAERTATFVREADLAYPLGPASARPYLDLEVLERALRETGADAAWVGWGFVAEDPAFAELCDQLGVTFIGPSAEAMRKLGDKIGSKLLAEEVGVPVAPWSRGAVDALEDALAASKSIGYPLMLKATAGGGGRGIRVITSEEDLVDAFDRTRDEAARAFGSGVVFLERLVTGARHVEVQVIADGQGTAWALGVRDCSIQRRNQKVIEESASPVLTAEQAEELKESAERLALAVGYRGAGTVEFLYHPKERTFAFLEVNTRLQVEHPITELTTDVDLVKAQLHVAAGGRLEGDQPLEIGHAVEARLNAEDPDRDFAPAPGRIELLDLPAGPGIRVDTGVSEGDLIPADFDSMIAKIIAYGRTRDEALARLRRALAETTVVIEGGATNKSFLLDLLDQPELIDGSADTGWIDRVRARGRLVTHRHAGIALVAAGDRGLRGGGAGRAPALPRHRARRPAAGPARDRPRDRPEAARRRAPGGRRPDRPAPVPGRRRCRRATGRPVDAGLERLDDYAGRLEVGDQRFRLLTATHGPVHLVEVDGITHRVTRDEGGVLRSPAPALVVAIPVAVGDEVEAGAPVLVLESMKMETVLHRAVRGPGPRAAGRPPAARSRPARRCCGWSRSATARRPRPRRRRRPPPTWSCPAQAWRLGATGRSAAGRPARPAARLRPDPRDEGRTLSDYRAARAELAAAGLRPVAAETDAVARVRRPVRAGPQPAGRRGDGSDDRVHSPREYFHAYLHSLDVDREQLPESFRGRLARVLAHYGVTELDRTPALEEAVFRIFLAQQRTAADLALVTTLLQQWMPTRRPSPGSPTRSATCSTGWCWPPSCATRWSATWPAAPGSAGSTSRWSRPSGLECWTGRAGRAGLPGRAARTRPTTPPGSRRWPASPSGSSGFLAERLEQGIGRARADARGAGPPALPRARAARPAHPRPSAGRPFVVVRLHPGRAAEPPGHHAGHRRRAGRPAGAGRSGRERGRAGRGRAGRPRAVVDLYLVWPEAPESPDEASARLRRAAGRGAVRAAGPPGRRRRVPRRRPPGLLLHLPARAGRRVVEDDLVRGVHPMVGRRLNLWRLRNFTDHPAGRARGRAALPLRRRRTTRPTSGWSRWPRSASWPWCATPDGRGGLAAARRAGGGQLPGGDPPGARRPERPAPGWT